MSDVRFIPESTGPRIRFEVAPVHNMLCSLCLLNQPHLDHISPWVDRTLAALTPEEKQAAELACDTGMFIGESAAGDVSRFASELRGRDPEELAAIAMDRLLVKAERQLGPDGLPSRDEIRRDRDAYLGVVKRLLDEYGEPFDPEEASREYERYQDPSAFRDRLADGIELLWKNHLADEWERVRPAIEDSVRAFRSVRLPSGDLASRLQYVTGRDFVPGEWVELVSAAQEIVCVPSVHIGPYMILFEFDGRRAFIVCRARIPEGATVRSPALDRSDLLMKLDALSDSTRLRVLELSAERGLVTTQDVIDALELSQSSASRHLIQLAATGLLTVDGSERTKKYRVNPRRIDDVCGGLKALVARRSSHEGGTR